MGGQPKIPLFNSLLRKDEEDLDYVKQTLKAPIRGFPKQQFVLKDTNQHAANLVVDNKMFQLLTATADSQASPFWMLVPGLFLLAVELLAFYGLKSNRTKEVSLFTPEY